MASSSKRQKLSPPAFNTQDDFISLGGNNDVHNRQHHRDHKNQFHDRRNAGDRPHSKFALPGYEPWILVKTKLRRRFVHNSETKESLWRIPKEVLPGVTAFEQWERDREEKNDNAKWAEEQLQQMRQTRGAEGANRAADAESRNKRRRSESLQREDEAAVMTELAAQVEKDEGQDVKETLRIVERGRPPKIAYDSEGSYEEIEVTDSEFEDEDDAMDMNDGHQVSGTDAEQESGTVEFGEDDIAWQLAAMGEDHDMAHEDESGGDGDWANDDEGLPLTEADAANLFRDLLDDHQISPFTLWETIIADESDMSILHDDRYSIIPNMRLRKEIFDVWVRDRAAQMKAEREAMEKLDPRIPYLEFLHEKATPKLYWPEFKRKFKREPELNDRKLSDKDREKLYRDHVTRLKLPETTRKADLLALLKRVPLDSLNKTTPLVAMSQQIRSHLYYISLPSAVRDRVIESHVRALPVAKGG